jgi:Protein of unknown function (DUF3307)
MSAAALAHHDVLLLTALGYLLFKHYVADFCVQTPYQFMNKGRYGHPGGLLHSGIHALLTIPVVFILKPSLPHIGAAIVATEFLVHYHIDWGKEQLTRLTGWTPNTSRYWQLFGFDQLLHGLTYVAIIIVLLSYPAPGQP